MAFAPKGNSAASGLALRALQDSPGGDGTLLFREEWKGRLEICQARGQRAEGAFFFG